MIRLDVEENELVASMLGALGMFHVGWQERVNTMSDWVIESMQEIVSKMNKAERELPPIPNVHIDYREH